MFGTVSATISEKSSPREVAALLRQLHDGANQTSRFRRWLDTTGSGGTIYTSDPIPDGSVLTIQVFAQGNSTDGTAWYCGKSVALVYRPTGSTVSILGQTPLFAVMSGAQSMTISVNTTDNTVLVTVDDDAATMSWSSWIELHADWGGR
jgi:hypothetical protein